MSVVSEFPVLQRLLAQNVGWSEAVSECQPDFVPNLANNKQTPEVLWIGCSDSRVPESVITASKPGDIFVHRNIANQFHPHDDNALSVVAYAVHYLHVKHIIVVGHSKCGGAAACYHSSLQPETEPTTPLTRWLAPLTSAVRSMDLSSVSEDEALKIVEEKNVKIQVKNIARNDVVHGAGKVWVHGWIFDLGEGRLRDLGISQGVSKD